MIDIETRLSRIERALYHLADDYGHRLATLNHPTAEMLYEEVRQIIEPDFKMIQDGMPLDGLTRSQLKMIIREHLKHD